MKLLFMFSALGILSLSACTTYRGVGRLSGGYHNELVYPGRPIPQGPDVFSLDWPIDRARLTQPFDLYKARPHWGLDLAAGRGTAVLAAHNGRVIYVGDGFTGYGNLVIVEYDDQWATFYAHLDDIFVREGEMVSQGEKIAAMGDTGRATGVHLHFELRYQHKPIDPLLHLP